MTATAATSSMNTLDSAPRAEVLPPIDIASGPDISTLSSQKYCFVCVLNDTMTLILAAPTLKKNAYLRPPVPSITSILATPLLTHNDQQKRNVVRP